MANRNPAADDGRDWSRITRAASVLALAVGTFMLLVGIAVEGPSMLGYTVVGVAPLLLGTLGVARARWRSESSGVDPSIDPMEELKRRYATGEIEDDELERKVGFLLDADDARRSGNGTRRGRDQADREVERSAR